MANRFLWDCLGKKNMSVSNVLVSRMSVYTCKMNVLVSKIRVLVSKMGVLVSKLGVLVRRMCWYCAGWYDGRKHYRVR